MICLFEPKDTFDGSSYISMMKIRFEREERQFCMITLELYKLRGDK